MAYTWGLLGSCTPAGASGGSPACSSPLPQCKEEAVGTLDAVQVLAGVSQLLPKSRENYLNRCMDQERLRRESTSQKEMDKVGTQLQVPSHRWPTQVRGICRGVTELPAGRVKTYHRAMVIEPA